MPRRVDPAKIHQRYITRSVRDLLLFYGRQLVGWRFFLSSFFIDYMKDRCSTAGQINFIASVSFGWLHSHRMFSSNIKPSLRSCWSRSRPQINRHFHVNPPNNGPQISRHGNIFFQLRSKKPNPFFFRKLSCPIEQNPNGSLSPWTNWNIHLLFYLGSGETVFAEKRRALGGEKSLICIQNGHK